jgi:AraC-like DNA-binding protein
LITKAYRGDFICPLQLKKAVQIMTHEDVSLTEVMYRIGIQTQSYFTKPFKKEFGKTFTHAGDKAGVSSPHPGSHTFFP